MAPEIRQPLLSQEVGRLEVVARIAFVEGKADEGALQPVAKVINLFADVILWRQDIQHNDIQYNNIQHYGTQHNDIQHNNKKMRHSAL